MHAYVLEVPPNGTAAIIAKTSDSGVAGDFITNKRGARPDRVGRAFSCAGRGRDPAGQFRWRGHLDCSPRSPAPSRAAAADGTVTLFHATKVIGVGVATATGGVATPITVDGSLTDWTASERINPSDTSGYDLYGTEQNGAYYFAIQAPTGVEIGAGTTIYFDNDQNVSTGYDIYGGAIGADYELTLNSGTSGTLDSRSTANATQPAGRGSDA